MWRSGKDHYGIVAMGFHWTIALAIVGLVGTRGLDGGAHLLRSLVLTIPSTLHKAIGIVVLALVVAKFGWKLADRKPGFGPEVRPYERAGATAMHWVLNALMIVLPITGYLISTSEDAAIDMFGLYDLPALFDVSADARDFAIDIHYYVAYGGIALVALHIGASLKHHFIDRGSTLTRMLVPRSRPEAARGRHARRAWPRPDAQVARSQAWPDTDDRFPDVASRTAIARSRTTAMSGNTPATARSPRTGRRPRS